MFYSLLSRPIAFHTTILLQESASLRLPSFHQANQEQGNSKHKPSQHQSKPPSQSSEPEQNFPQSSHSPRASDNHICRLCTLHIRTSNCNRHPTSSAYRNIHSTYNYVWRWGNVTLLGNYAIPLQHRC